MTRRKAAGRAVTPGQVAKPLPKPPTIIEALADPELFGGMFDAPSWARWKVFLKALFGLPMDDEELAIYRYHTARQAAPQKPARYAELVCGRRGGKSRTLSLIAVYLGCVLDHRPFLVPGETPVIAVIAKDREQAKVIKNYIVGFLREIPAFAGMIEDELAESVRLSNRVVVEVHTASLAAPRGRTFLAVLCDEIAFWPSGDSANPDVEVVNAVRPGLSTIPYSLLLLASSPYAKRGVLYSNYAKYFGVDDGSVLVWQGSTSEMNDTLVDDEVAADMYLTDPDRASAEYGAEFRSDIAAFLTREALEAVIPRGVVELPPGGGITYSAFCDPSGGSADSMTMAIAHLEPDGTAVLDATRERRPPFSPDDVTQEFAALMKAYGVSRCHGDRYAGVWPRERFAVHGISYEVSERTKSQIYQEFLPAVNGRRIRLLDQPRMTSQFVTLERRTARGGRDSIDHEDGAKDDVANSAAGVLVQTLEDRRPALIKPSDLLTPERQAVEPHTHPEAFLAALWLDRQGVCGWTIWSFRWLSGIEPVPLILIDFARVPFGMTVLDDVVRGLDELFTAKLREQPDLLHRVAVSFWVPAQLVDVARGLIDRTFGARRLAMEELGMMRGYGPRIAADPIDAAFLEQAEQVILDAAVFTATGKVKMSPTALARSDGQPLAGILSAPPGERVDADPLRMAALIEIRGLGLAMKPPEGAVVRW